MVNKSKKTISIIVIIICVCVLVAAIVVGCVLQNKNAWKHRYELMSSEGNTQIVANISKEKEKSCDFDHMLIQHISSKLEENKESFYKSIVFYEVDLYLYNDGDEEKQHTKRYYTYIQAHEEDKVTLITEKEFNDAVATASFEYNVNILL